MTSYPHPPPRGELKWAAIDLDGTLAEPVWTPDNPVSEIGPPIWANVEKLIRLHEAGYKIVVHSSRPWTDYEAIEVWCGYYRIPVRRIQCGKILAAIYVDDRGRHASAGSWLPT